MLRCCKRQWGSATRFSLILHVTPGKKMEPFTWLALWLKSCWRYTHKIKLFLNLTIFLMPSICLWLFKKKKKSFSFSFYFWTEKNLQRPDGINAAGSCLPPFPQRTWLHESQGMWLLIFNQTGLFLLQCSSFPVSPPLSNSLPRRPVGCCITSVRWSSKVSRTCRRLSSWRVFV